MSKSGVLFRGISDDNYLLQSTLERSSLVDADDVLSVYQFLRYIEDIRPTIESLRGLSIDEIHEGSAEEFFNDNRYWYRHYSYLIYLRHHGFPSPLLDWTASPYVAAYFALRSEKRAKDASPYVAIHVFVERPRSGKSWAENEPHIQTLGPRTKAHLRHIRQQSSYTICLQQVSGKHCFVPYSSALTSLKKDPTQDVFWKILIPVSERSKAIAELDLMNVNAYTLFDSDDSLMETLYFRCTP